MAQIPTDRNLSSPMGDLPTMVALGAIPGWRAFRKFGRNDDVDGNEEMWEYGTSRVLPTSGAALSVVSSSTADDNTTGTGAWTIIVEGLDSNYTEISETIIMDGTTPAASSGSDWFRVNRAYVYTAGTGEVNAGNIDITIGGNEQAYIEANEGQTHQTHYTVPAGHTLLLSGLSLVAGTLGNAHMIVETQIKPAHTDSAWRSVYALDLTDGEVFTHNGIKVPSVLEEKTELRQKLIFSGTNGEVAGELHGYLINDVIQGNFG